MSSLGLMPASPQRACQRDVGACAASEEGRGVGTWVVGHDGPKMRMDVPEFVGR